MEVIKGILGEVFFRLIYSDKPISDTSYDDGLVQSPPDMTLEDPEPGIPGRQFPGLYHPGDQYHPHDHDDQAG